MLLIYLYLFIIGSAVGSFLNVLIDRLPNEESIAGRSHCDYCKKQLPAGVNIPIVSWFMLKGKTQCCGKPLSLQYPIIEALTGVMFVVIWYIAPFFFYPVVLQWLAWIPDSQIGGGETAMILLRITLLVMGSTLLVTFVADVKYHIIPDSMQVLFLITAVLFVSLTGVLSLNTFKDGCIVLLPILLLYVVTLGRGMGFADVKFAFSMGVLLGWMNGLLALYIAFITGAVVGIALMIAGRKKMKSTIAFGPFLIVGTVMVLVAHEQIIPFLSHFLMR